MSFSDWIVDLLLIGLVLLQLRGRRLTPRSLLLPVGLVAWAASRYLHGIPTAGSDLLLVVTATVVGLSLGAGAGALTRVRREADGAVFARATVGAAVLWVLGVGFRLAFQLYATHGGGASLGRFSAVHHLDAAGWTSAIILMAFAEVVARTATVWARGLAAPRLLDRGRDRARAA